MHFDAEGKPKPLDKVQRLDEFLGGYSVEEIDSDALKPIRQAPPRQAQEGCHDQSVAQRAPPNVPAGTQKRQIARYSSF
jgi:hypothetical protein